MSPQNTFEKIPPDSAVHVINYWSLMNEKFDHAGDVETSILLAVKPILVKMDKAEGNWQNSHEVERGLQKHDLPPGFFP